MIVKAPLDLRCDYKLHVLRAMLHANCIPTIVGNTISSRVQGDTQQSASFRPPSHSSSGELPSRIIEHTVVDLFIARITVVAPLVPSPFLPRRSVQNSSYSRGTRAGGDSVNRLCHIFVSDVWPLSRVFGVEEERRIERDQNLDRRTNCHLQTIRKLKKIIRDRYKDLARFFLFKEKKKRKKIFFYSPCLAKALWRKCPSGAIEDSSLVGVIEKQRGSGIRGATNKNRGELNRGPRLSRSRERKDLSEMVEALLESGGQDVAVADNGQSRAGTPTECTPKIGQIMSDNLNLTPIQRFYAGHNVFITGGTGFLGKLLIEKLLRSCSGISNIYLLVRPKKGKDTHERTEQIFDDPLFEKLKGEQPKFRYKIVTIEGDCSLPGLGISEADKATLMNEVSIVFHVAATVRFDEKIKLAVAINVQSVRYMIALCKKMPKLKSFVHVSTAYAYCTQNPIEEKFYDTPIDADKLITMMECTDEDLANVITPHLLGKWPNTYSFTKAVAESVVQKEVTNMPIGIFRPAIVVSTYQEPIRGWIDNMYGPTGVAAGAGIGLLRSLHCDGNTHANVVPGDMVINALISAAWDIAESKRQNIDSTEEPVYNFVSKDNPITYDDLKILSAKYGINYPSTKAIWYYSFRNNKHKIVHLFFVYFLHILPAFIIDAATVCIGKQPRFLKLYKKIHKFMDVLRYFVMQNWDFSNDNVNRLNAKLTDDDRKMFFFDMKSLSWETYFQTYIQGIRLYLFKDPMETLPVARVKWQRMYWLHQAVKLLLAYGLLRIAWSIILALLPIA